METKKIIVEVTRPLFVNTQKPFFKKDWINIIEVVEVTAGRYCLTDKRNEKMEFIFCDIDFLENKILLKFNNDKGDSIIVQQISKEEILNNYNLYRVESVVRFL